MRSGLIAPVAIGDRVAGTLGVASRRVGAFDSGTLAILQALAGYLSVALLLEERHRREVELATAVTEARDLATQLLEEEISEERRLDGLQRIADRCHAALAAGKP